MSDPIRVLIADDYLLLRDGIAVLIANCHDIVVVGQAENGMEAIEHSGEAGLTPRELQILALIAGGGRKSGPRRNWPSPRTR